MNEEGSHCSICLDVATQNAKTLLCGHIFHELCLNIWCEKANNCPNCRSPLMDKESACFMNNDEYIKCWSQSDFDNFLRPFVGRNQYAIQSRSYLECQSNFVSSLEQSLENLDFHSVRESRRLLRQSSLEFTSVILRTQNLTMNEFS